MATKKIELEMYFDDGFVPPDRYDKDRCSGLCPFLSYDADDTSEGFCCLTTVRSPEEECPIRKYFPDTKQKEGQ